MKILNYILLFVFSLFASPLFGKSILEMYRGSVQEKMLDEQIARYRKHAKMNAETFLWSQIFLKYKKIIA